MRLPSFRWLAFVPWAVSAPAQQPQLSAEQTAFFENKIRPLLAQECQECHSAAKGKTKGSLNMDTREDLRRGGQSGVVLIPGKPEESPLIAAVEGRGDSPMPPKKHLSSEQITALKQWIAMGAPDPREKDARTPRPVLNHWAFKPLTQSPEIPAVRDRAWVRTEIDAFVLARLEAQGMSPAPRPESGTPEEVRRQKEALLRRAFFDLVGLPPGPEHLRAFVADSAPNAFEKRIDQLLESPRYGERWARHWMDTARYSDTGGVPERGFDQRFPYAWGYRDWIIKACNDDMPYDQFILNQLAADYLHPKPNPHWAGLAFLPIGQSSSQPDEIINERIGAVGRGFLGMTLSCARCHDHKFDPVTQADYYALHGVFKSTTQPDEGPVIWGGDSQTPEYQAYLAELNRHQNHAWAAYLHIAKRENARMRRKAAAYFQWALATEKKIEADRQSLDALKTLLNLEGDDTYWVRGEFAPNFKFNGRDPVLGPFVALAHRNEKYLNEILSGRRTGYNPVVLKFFNLQKNLPWGPEEAAACFERFWKETVEPVAGVPVDPQCTDFVAEVVSGKGMTTQIWHLRENVVNHAELPLMELAVYPYRLIAPGLALRGNTRRLAIRWN